MEIINATMLINGEKLFGADVIQAACLINRNQV